MSDGATTREEALEQYADVIKIPCPDCGKPAGKLCDTAGVWVHFGRFQAADPKTYPWELWPL